MMKNNPIIKATMVLVAFVYICLAIYMLTQGITVFKLTSSLLNSIVLIVGSTMLGFCITLVAISAIKNYQLNLLLKANSNGRYGTTQGYLPKRHELTAEKISLKNDLPEALQVWVKTHETSNKAAIDLFITLAGILKNRLNLYAEGSTSITLYAHSIKLCERLVELSSKGADACNAFLIEKGYLSPNNMKLKYIEELVSKQALVLIGIMHDIGKVNSFIQTDGVITYLDNHPQKAKLCVSAIDSFWKLDENIRDSLLFATAYYNNLPNCPKTIFDKRLVAKYMQGELLVQFLIASHNEVASYEIIQYNPVENKSLAHASNKNDEVLPDEGVKIVITAKQVSTDDAVNIPKPKKKQVATNNQAGESIAKEVTNQKIISNTPEPATKKTGTKIKDNVSLDALFSQPQKSIDKSNNKKSSSANKDVKLSEVFGGKND